MQHRKGCEPRALLDSLAWKGNSARRGLMNVGPWGFSEDFFCGDWKCDCLGEGTASQPGMR